MATKLDPQVAVNIASQLGALERKQQADPAYRTQLTSGEKMLRSFASPATMSTMSKTAQRELTERVDQTVERYYTAILNNPEMDPMALARGLYEDAYKSTVGDDVDDFQDEATPEQIRTKQQEIFKTYQDKKKKGLMTRQQDKEFVQQMQKLELQRQKLLQLNRSQQMQPNPTRGGN